jgi:hypothetical protein
MKREVFKNFFNLFTFFPSNPPERKYYFMGLDGKENFVSLGGRDKLLHEKCPFDGSNLVFVENIQTYGWDKKCPCCNLPYFNPEYLEKPKEKLEKYIQEEYLSKLKKETVQLKQTLISLENLLLIIENKYHPILKMNLRNRAMKRHLHEPNLSANKLENKIANRSIEEQYTSEKTLKSPEFVNKTNQTINNSPKYRLNRQFSNVVQLINKTLNNLY